MQIVIDIDENCYKDCKTMAILSAEQGQPKLGYIYEKIADGIPLPKGHGRLIDADKLRYKHSLNMVNTTMPQSFPCITKDEINKTPTVEAIPKADYENRLKADLEAILVELQLKIEELDTYDIERTHGLIEDGYVAKDVNKVIQQKINELF